MSDLGFGRTAAVVLALAAAATALVLAAASARAEEPSANVALHDLGLLHVAIARHRALLGAIPSDRNALGAVARAHAQSVEARGGLAVDPWLVPYAYHPADGPDGVYALYSLGANGVDDGGRDDDIISRESVDRGLYPELYDRERQALALFPILILVILGPVLFALMKLARRHLS